MTCKNWDRPHVHRQQECPICLHDADYELLKPEESVRCAACGFEIELPADFIQYTRDLLQIAERRDITKPMVFNGSLSSQGITIEYVDEISLFPPPGVMERLAKVLPRFFARFQQGKEAPPWLDGLA